MDLRTGKTYSSAEEARADGVPQSDLAYVEPSRDSRVGPPKVKFSKGSFKKIEQLQER